MILRWAGGRVDRDVELERGDDLDLRLEPGRFPHGLQQLSRRLRVGARRTCAVAASEGDRQRRRKAPGRPSVVREQPRQFILRRASSPRPGRTMDIASRSPGPFCTLLLMRSQSVARRSALRTRTSCRGAKSVVAAACERVDELATIVRGGAAEVSAAIGGRSQVTSLR